MGRRLAAIAVVLVLGVSYAGAQTVDPVSELNAAKTDINAALALNPKQAVRTRLISARTHIDNALAAMQTTTTTAAPTTTVAPSTTAAPTTTAVPTTTQAPTTTIAPTTTTVPPTTTTMAPAGGFPTATSVGVPAGWTPVTTRSTSMTITTAGAIVEDIRFTNGAELLVNAANVTVRRVEFLGGNINNFPGATCRSGMVVEDVSFKPPPGATFAGTSEGAIRYGGYTARRVSIVGYVEGMRVGGKWDGCGPVSISDSYIGIVPPQPCGDWHGDGIQGYDGSALTIRNVNITMVFDPQGCGGTAPFFYPHSQGNTSVDIDRLRVKGGGYSFRNGMPGKVLNLEIVEGWFFGPIDVKCSVITQWSASIVNTSGVFVRNQPCNTEAGN